MIFAPDQLVRACKRSLLVPFFGEPAVTHSGLVDIARDDGRGRSALSADAAPAAASDPAAAALRDFRTSTADVASASSTTWLTRPACGSARASTPAAEAARPTGER